MPSITFLGTGGGRYVLLSQRRYTGGIWLNLESSLVLDPGPGSLIRALQFGKNPEKLDAVMVSHKHLDHYNDAELMLEAMTKGVKRRHGYLVIDENALEYVSSYHQNSVDVLVPKPGDSFRLGYLKVQAIPAKSHEGMGFRFLSDDGTVTYTSDTDYSKDLIKHYKNSRILIINSIFPSGMNIKSHLNADDALRIVEEAKPELAVLNHFGMQMLNRGPEKEAKRIQEKTGIRTIAARDGMTLDLKKLDEEVKQLKLGNF